MKLVAVIEAHVCHSCLAKFGKAFASPSKRRLLPQSPQSRDISLRSPSGNINENNYELQECVSVIGGMTPPIPTHPTTHTHPNSPA